MAAVLGCILLGIAIGRLLAPSAPAKPPAASPTAPAATTGAFAPLAGAPLTVSQTLGTSARLSTPLEAIALPGGRIAVADTGNARLVVLDATGRLVHSTRPGEGGLKQPYALVATAGGIDVLDAQADAIVRFDLGGHIVRTLVHDAALHDARGMAVGPDGRLYVANPLTNSIVVLSADGAIQAQIHTPNGAGLGQFNQVCDVAVTPNGHLYILDNQNDRIEELANSGAFLEEWPAPASSTLLSVHILPLSDGRMVASDPSGALLVYPRGGGSPYRSVLQLNGQALSGVEPLGIAPDGPDHLLVADGRGNRILVVNRPLNRP